MISALFIRKSLFWLIPSFVLILSVSCSLTRERASNSQSQQTKNSSQPSISRSDSYVNSDPGIRLFVREVRSTRQLRNPILLVHGGGPGGIASFDINVPGYSIAEDFAQAGYPVYIMNLRGWEKSTRLAGLDQPPNVNPPLVTSEVAVRDIGAVVDWIRQRHRNQSVALVGHASGGHWAGLYTSRNPQSVSHLVMLNSLYGVNAPWNYRRTFSRKDRPEQFDFSAAAYREVTAAGLITNWTNTIPTQDKNQWRDPAVVKAMQTLVFENDPTSKTRKPPSVRVPGGFRLDAFNLSRGQRLWNAADIRVPTLVIRGEQDHWSRPTDLQALDAELVNTPRKKTVTIAGGTHYLFLDRPERGHDRFIQEVLSFLILKNKSITHAIAKL